MKIKYIFEIHIYALCVVNSFSLSLSHTQLCSSMARNKCKVSVQRPFQFHTRKCTHVHTHTTLLDISTAWNKCKVVVQRPFLTCKHTHTHTCKYTHANTTGHKWLETKVVSGWRSFRTRTHRALLDISMAWNKCKVLVQRHPPPPPPTHTHRANARTQAHTTLPDVSMAWNKRKVLVQKPAHSKCKHARMHNFTWYKYGLKQM